MEMVHIYLQSLLQTLTVKTLFKQSTFTNKRHVSTQQQKQPGAPHCCSTQKTVTLTIKPLNSILQTVKM